MQSLTSIRQLVFGFITAVALMVPVISKAQVVTPSTPPSQTENSAITGQVTDKSDSMLMIDAKTVVAIITNTTFSRGGQSITLNDIKVGDTVKVATVKGAQGDLLATKVEVFTKAGSQPAGGSN